MLCVWCVRFVRLYVVRELVLVVPQSAVPQSVVAALQLASFDSFVLLFFWDELLSELQCHFGSFCRKSKLKSQTTAWRRNDANIDACADERRSYSAETSGDKCVRCSAF